MAADEFRRRMGDDVSAPLKRAAQVRGGKRVVNHQRNVKFTGDGGYRLKRKNVDEGVAQGLAVKDFGVGFDGPAEIFRVAGVNKGGFDAQAGESVLELVKSAAVQG